MKDYIKIGIEKGLISFNDDMSRITYVHQKKERNYNNPEEKVQAETFLRLILDYNYPVNRIKQFVPVPMGLQTGAAQPHVYAADLQMLNIPVMSIDKQRDMINHIANIRTHAKALQTEGKAILEEAKRKIEK